MDFRITPFLFSLAHNLLMLWANPNINSVTELNTLANRPKWIAIYAILMALSLGAYFRHSYYSKLQQLTYWLLQVCSIGLLIGYWLSIEAEHLT